MKIKVAVTDACVFIDLYNLSLVSSFFNLELEIHTTTAVYFELYDEQQLVLEQLVATNFIFQNNKQVVDEIQKRLKLWI